MHRRKLRYPGGASLWVNCRQETMFVGLQSTPVLLVITDLQLLLGFVGSKTGKKSKGVVLLFEFVERVLQQLNQCTPCYVYLEKSSGKRLVIKYNRKRGECFL